MLMQLLLRIVLIAAALVVLVLTPAIIQTGSETRYDVLGLAIDGVSLLVLLAVATSTFRLFRHAA